MLEPGFKNQVCLYSKPQALLKSIVALLCLFQNNATELLLSLSLSLSLSFSLSPFSNLREVKVKALFHLKHVSFTKKNEQYSIYIYLQMFLLCELWLYVIFSFSFWWDQAFLTELCDVFVKDYHSQTCDHGRVILASCYLFPNL